MWPLTKWAWWRERDSYEFRRAVAHVLFHVAVFALLIAWVFATGDGGDGGWRKPTPPPDEPIKFPTEFLLVKR